MKPKNEASKNYSKPVEVEEKTIESEVPEVQPVKAKTVYRVKCIWNGPVKVAANKTPSGAAYDFQPQEEKPIDSKADMLYLTGLKRGESGCCGSTGQTRHYFVLV